MPEFLMCQIIHINNVIADNLSNLTKGLTNWTRSRGSMHIDQQKHYEPWTAHSKNKTDSSSLVQIEG